MLILSTFVSSGLVDLNWDDDEDNDDDNDDDDDERESDVDRVNWRKAATTHCFITFQCRRISVVICGV